MMTSRLERKRGFTLIELIVAVLIVAILASVAFPAYQDQVLRSRRAEGKAALLRAAQLQERNYVNGDPTITDPLLPRPPTYVNTGALAMLFGLAANDPIFSGETPAANTGWYAISVDLIGGTCTTSLQDCFVVRAIPNNAAPRNFSDAQCNQLTLDNAGRRGTNGTRSVADCWDR